MINVTASLRNPLGDILLGPQIKITEAQCKERNEPNVGNPVGARAATTLQEVAADGQDKAGGGGGISAVAVAVFSSDGL